MTTITLPTDVATRLEQQAAEMGLDIVAYLRYLLDKYGRAPAPRITPAHIRAHRHCTRHRDEILASDRCACFHCLQTFPPIAVTEWTDGPAGQSKTALCPHCGIDSVIGTASGYPITPEFLQRMHSHWF